MGNVKWDDDPGKDSPQATAVDNQDNRHTVQWDNQPDSTAQTTNTSGVVWDTQPSNTSKSGVVWDTPHYNWGIESLKPVAQVALGAIKNISTYAAAQPVHSDAGIFGDVPSPLRHNDSVFSQHRDKQSEELNHFMNTLASSASSLEPLVASNPAYQNNPNVALHALGNTLGFASQTLLQMVPEVAAANDAGAKIAASRARGDAEDVALKHGNEQFLLSEALYHALPSILHQLPIATAVSKYTATALERAGINNVVSRFLPRAVGSAMGGGEFSLAAMGANYLNDKLTYDPTTKAPTFSQAVETYFGGAIAGFAMGGTDKLFKENKIEKDYGFNDIEKDVARLSGNEAGHMLVAGLTEGGRHHLTESDIEPTKKFLIETKDLQGKDLENAYKSGMLARYFGITKGDGSFDWQSVRDNPDMLAPKSRKPLPQSTGVSDLPVDIYGSLDSESRAKSTPPWEDAVGKIETGENGSTLTDRSLQYARVADYDKYTLVSAELRSLSDQLKNSNGDRVKALKILGEIQGRQDFKTAWENKNYGHVMPENTTGPNPKEMGWGASDLGGKIAKAMDRNMYLTMKSDIVTLKDRLDLVMAHGTQADVASVLYQHDIRQAAVEKYELQHHYSVQSGDNIAQPGQVGTGAIDRSTQWHAYEEERLARANMAIEALAHNADMVQAQADIDNARESGNAKDLEAAADRGAQLIASSQALLHEGQTKRQQNITNGKQTFLLPDGSERAHVVSDSLPKSSGDMVSKILSMFGIKARVAILDLKEGPSGTMNSDQSSHDGIKISNILSLADHDKMVEMEQIRKQGRARGLFGASSDGTILIGLDSSINKQHQPFEMCHEVGHLLFEQLWCRATPEEKASILYEYKEWIKDHIIKGSSFNEILGSRHNDITNTTQQPSETLLNGEKYSYLFREYMADHIAKWETNSKETRPIVSGFFGKVSDMIKKIMGVYRQYEPASSVASFMDRMLRDSGPVPKEDGGTTADALQYLKNTPTELSALQQPKGDLDFTKYGVAIALNRAKFDYTSELTSGAMEIGRFAHELKTKFSDMDLVHMLHNMDLFESGSEWAANRRGITPEMVEAFNKVKGIYHEQFLRLQKVSSMMSDQEVASYVSRMWESPAGSHLSSGELVQEFRDIMQGKSLYGRKILGIVDGYRMGMHLKYANLADELVRYVKQNNAVIARSNYIDKITKIHETTPDGVEPMVRVGSAGPNYHTLDHPAFRNRATGAMDIADDSKVAQSLKKIAKSVFGTTNPNDAAMKNGSIVQILGMERFFKDHTDALAQYNRETNAAGKLASPQEQARAFLVNMLTNPHTTSVEGTSMMMHAMDHLVKSDILDRLMPGMANAIKQDMINQARDTKTGDTYFHDAVFHDVKVLFQPAADAEWIRAVNAVNASAKISQFMFSLFHATNMSLRALPELGPKGLWNIWSRSVDAVKNDNFIQYVTNRETMDLAIKGYGVNLDLPIDARTQEMAGFLKIADEQTRGTVLNRLVKAMSSFNTINDRFMWGHLMSSMKMHMVELMESRLDHTQDPTMLALKRQEAGRWINDILGGQSLADLGISKNVEQAMRMFMLAPDWEISSLRHFGSMGSELFPIIRNLTGQNSGLTSEGRKAHQELASYKGNMARAHWAKAATMIYTSMTLMNMLTRTLWPMDDKDKNSPIWQKGMWSNDIGHRLGVYTGRTQDGANIYAHPLKSFMEAPELLMDHTGTGPLGFRMKPDAAVEKLGAKASPVISSVIASFTGVEPGGHKDDIYGAKGMAHLGDIAKRLAKIWVPYSANNIFNPSTSPQQKILSLVTQSQRGANPREIQDLYEKALDMMAAGDETGSRELMTQATYAALNNGINAVHLRGIAQSTWTSNKARESNMGIENEQDVRRALTQPMSILDRQALMKRLKSIEVTKAALANKESQVRVVMNDFQRLASLNNTTMEAIHNEAEKQQQPEVQWDE